MRFHQWLCASLALGFAVLTLHGSEQAPPKSPKAAVKLFNGVDLTGFTPWLKKTGHADPQKVFSVHDGVIHVSGEDNGYLATDKEYRDYRLTVEYKWGKRTDGG